MLLLLGTVAPAMLLGCAADGSHARTDSPEMAAYVQLVMPAQIKILEWTKPVSLAADGNADGVEAVLEARDSFDDLTKVVGTLHFELRTRRLSDRMGTRVAFWPVEINSVETMRMYRDPLSRFYRFPLQLDQGPLKPGRYALMVWLLLPTGQRLLDEYEFQYDGAAAPPASSF